MARLDLSSSSNAGPAAPFLVPRAFPPPALSGVPDEYIVAQLRSLAPHYWRVNETADCTIVVPIPHARNALDLPSVYLPCMSDSAPGRRATEPSINAVPKISFELHIDYMSSQSTLLRGLFSGSSPLDLISSAPEHSSTYAPATSESSSPTASPSSSTTNLTVSGRFAIPPDRRPRLLPSSPEHPRILLPVPDPSSLQLLFHWMYFGDTQFIADCLQRGIVEWEGIARNVEYLGLPTEIKVFLGRWYHRCILLQDVGDEPLDETSEEEEATEEEASVTDDDTSVSDDDMSLASPGSDEKDDRGRDRTVRSLSSIIDPASLLVFD
ncbi:hypothetical protein FISHEDRAFT_64394 [Fistulina hepatica ATCC 64428]|nr:hypothetical protein FISHEDRAFT_64394 [Fistulina hepatica ATCC 64428]